MAYLPRGIASENTILLNLFNKRKFDSYGLEDLLQKIRRCIIVTVKMLAIPMFLMLQVKWYLSFFDC